MIKLNVGDVVVLSNGTIGKIKNIDETTLQFELDSDNIITWFYVRDINYINNVFIVNHFDIIL